MATPSDSSLSSVSSVSSPRFRSPWANIVRGESDSSAAVSRTSGSPSRRKEVKGVVVDFDCKVVPVVDGLIQTESSSDNGNVAAAAPVKKPAWNKPVVANGGVVEVSPVMGAVSWPALSDAATKVSSKSVLDTAKVLLDGGAGGAGAGSGAVSQGSVNASIPQKQVNHNANPNTNTNHPYPRQKSMKGVKGVGGGGGGGSGGSGVNGGQQQGPPPPPPLVPMVEGNLGKQGAVVPNSSPRDAHHKNNNNNWEGGQRGSGPHTGNDHQSQPNQNQRNFRRNGNGQHPRGRDQDRGNTGNHDWHHQNRSFNGRDVHMQHPRGVQRPFIRPPPPPAPVPFVSPPPPVRPFGAPMGFPDMASPVYYVPAPPPDSLRGMPFFHAAPFTMILPGAPDPNLRAMLMKQIDYYFSPENLCKDLFLRNHMDEQGWVSVSLIATFKRVKELTNNIPFILDVMRNSVVVEVQGDKLRKRNDWMNWQRPPTMQSASMPGPQSSGSTNHDLLAHRIQSIGLDGGNTSSGSSNSLTDSYLNGGPSRSSSQELISHPQSSDGEGLATQQ